MKQGCVPILLVPYFLPDPVDVEIDKSTKIMLKLKIGGLLKSIC